MIAIYVGLTAALKISNSELCIYEFCMISSANRDYFLEHR
jgi:hypothetical protein